MKKIASLCLCIALILSFASASFAEDLDFSPVVSVEKKIAHAGDTVELNIYLSGNAGFSDIGIEISYDSQYVELNTVKNIFTDINCIGTQSQYYTVNPYVLLWVSKSVDIAYNGCIATLVFKLSADAKGTIPIQVSYYKGRKGNNEDGTDVNTDAAGRSINLHYSSGCIELIDDNHEPCLNFAINNDVSGLVRDGSNLKIRCSGDFSCIGDIHYGNFTAMLLCYADDKFCGCKSMYLSVSEDQIVTVDFNTTDQPLTFYVGNASNIVVKILILEQDAYIPLTSACLLM